MTNSKALAQLHESTGVPPEIVAGLVKRAVGSSVQDLQRLVLGDENEVYHVRLAGQEVVYVRIRRPGTGTFGGEVWAMEQARAAGVAVPQLHTVQQIDTMTGSRAAMVVAAAPGQQLAQLPPNLAPDQRHTTLSNVGRTLARVHTIRVPGSGPSRR